MILIIYRYFVANGLSAPILDSEHVSLSRIDSPYGYGLQAGDHTILPSSTEKLL